MKHKRDTSSCGWRRGRALAKTIHQLLLFIYLSINSHISLFLLELSCISIGKRCNIGGWMYVNATFAAAARRCARVRYEICVFVAVCTWLYNPPHVLHPPWKHTKTHTLKTWDPSLQDSISWNEPRTWTQLQSQITKRGSRKESDAVTSFYMLVRVQNDIQKRIETVLRHFLVVN